MAASRWCCGLYYILQFDINLKYSQVEDSVSMHVSEDIDFDFTSHKYMIFIRDSHSSCYYKSENKGLKHFALDGNIYIDSVKFFKDKLLINSHYPQNGVIESYRWIF